MTDYQKTMLVHLTIQDLEEIIDQRLSMALQQVKKPVTTEKYIYGLNGLAKLLRCSRNKAIKIKRSGKLDEAIFQDGKKIAKALELYYS